MSASYRGFLTAMLVVGLVWAAGVVGLFRVADGWLYDQLVRLPMPGSVPDPQVLLVEVEPAPDAPRAGEWLKLLETLQMLGAAKIVFSFLPENAGVDFYRHASTRPAVLFGRSVETTDFSDAHGLEAWPQASRGLALPFGAVMVPPAEYGIHRRASVEVSTNSGTVPTLEAAVAGMDAVLAARQGEASFIVNFNQGRRWLPRVSARRLLDQGLVPRLVEGRTVLVGHKSAPDRPGLDTPLNAEGDPMTLLEFQGYAIDTLLGERYIRESSNVVNLLLLGLIGLASLFAYQWLGLAAGSWFTAVMVAAYVGTGWMVLHVSRVSVPVVEFITAQGVLFWLLVPSRLANDRQRIRQAVIAQAARLREHMLPPAFNDGGAPWPQLVALVDQTLELERFVFLELVPGDQCVRAVTASRCSLGDIEERERGHESDPYRRAIVAGMPVRLDERPYLKPCAECPEVQYLVPLMFEGKLQGFLVFGVDPTRVEASGHFLEHVSRVAVEIARLLFQRQRSAEEREKSGRTLPRLLGLEIRDSIHSEIERTLGTCGRQLHATRSALDSIATAAVCYDLFGRVTLLNKSLETFLRGAGIAAYDMNALEFLVSVSGIPVRKARRMLQQVVIDRSDFQVPVEKKTSEGERYAVSVRPIIVNEQEATESSSMPFQLAGIIFEFVDVTRLVQLLRPREQMLERLQWRLQNDLEALSAASYLLRQSAQTEQHAEERSEEGVKVAGSTAIFPRDTSRLQQDDLWLAGVIDEKVADIRAALAQLEPNLDEKASRQETAREAVDIQTLLAGVIGEMAPQAELRGVGIEVRQPAVVSLVDAHPRQLGRLLKALVISLLSDAADNSRVVIEVSERDDFVEYHFFNTGFGIPDDRLQAYLWNHDHPVTEEFRGLREAVRPVDGWGGEIALRSRVGVGTWGTLRLLAVR